MKLSLIEKQHDLDEVCATVNNGDLVAIDIEFLREKTFYPILCLIQINVGGREYAIDVLTEGLNLKPFVKILKNKKIIKILHSSFQDVEIMFQEFGIIPKSLYDTQMMANFLGFDFNVSYAGLVKELLNGDISKEQQRSNWQKRPLTDEQIEYSLNDVKYLPDLYRILLDRLVEQGKLKYFLKETQIVLGKKIYDIDKQDLYKKFSFVNKSSGYKAIVKALVVWRDKVSRENNIPRSFIVKDKVLSDIAKKNPKSSKELDSIFRSYNAYSKFKNRILKLLLDLKMPRNPDKRSKFIETRLNFKQKGVYEMAQDLLMRRGQEYGIRSQVIINQNDLKQIILKNTKLKKVLSGWRFEVFGKYLKKLI